MIVQAISLLDDLEKELNIYAMRVREWYGWHFPELGKIIDNNITYAKTVRKMGMRTNAQHTDLAELLGDEKETEVREAAKISMGTEISDEDNLNINALCDQVISIHEHRLQLLEYLKNRMNAIAPNLTVMVGEQVGARLIAHAGSLINLAKHPASTVQILGAEKALFRALKTRHETPKYGLIYHASLIGQAQPKNKGKISRVLAAKTALSIRVDALGDKVTADIGIENKAKVEARLRQLEGQTKHQISGTAKGNKNQEKYQRPTATTTYNDSADSTIEEKPKKDKKKKKKDEDSMETETTTTTTTTKIEEKAEETAEPMEETTENIETEKKQKKDKKKKKTKPERYYAEEGDTMEEPKTEEKAEETENQEKEKEKEKKKKKKNINKKKKKKAC